MSGASLTMKKSKNQGIKNKSALIPSPRTEQKNIIQKYMHEISKYPLLTREEEKKWTTIYYETKDHQALRVLVQSNLRFVVRVATQYSRFGSRLIDLIQEGNMGLLKAINEFNPYKGVRLITYSVWWIRGAIQEYLMKQHSIVRIGTTPNQKKLFYRLRKEEIPQLESALNTKLLSNQLGVPSKEIDIMRTRLSHKDVHIDGLDGRSKDGRVIDAEGSRLEEDIEQKQEIQMLQESVNKLRPSLKKKEVYILDHRVLSENPLTLQEIGNNFNVTRESIRQTEAQLLKKIKVQLNKKIPLSGK